MRLVVDASTLVAEALRVRGRRLFAHPDLELFVADHAWNETVHELGKRVVLLSERGSLAAREAAAYVDKDFAFLADRTTTVPSDQYDARLEETRWRIPRDPTDAPTVALALALDCGIWTDDRDFFGCGLPVWVTEVLQRSVQR